jgi:tyrosinase
LNSHAQTIASQYYGANKAKFIAAAKTLRIPYWDWAASAAIPTILSTPKITITTPAGERQIDNPLFAYKFPPLDPKYFPNQGAYDSYLANDSTTIRDPNANSNLIHAGLTPATVSTKLCGIFEPVMLILI